MKRTRFATALCAPVFVLTLLTAGPAAADPTAPTPTAADVATRVQGFYDQTRTYQANFEQTYKIKKYNQTKKSSGRVVFKKPGKMNWEYDAPNGNRVVSDGRTLRVYEKENNTLYEQNVDNKSQYPAALAFLAGTGNLANAFALKLLSTVHFEGGYVLEGTPKEATPAYQKVLFFVDGATAQVRQVIMIDAERNQNNFTFSAPAVNIPVDDAQFNFEPPQGTQVIHP